MNRLFVMLCIVGLSACSGDEPNVDAGAPAPIVDAAVVDTGSASRPPDAGFGGGLGARCQRDSDCDNPSHKCLIGNYPNTRHRCSTTCVRTESCYDYAEGAGISRDEVTCEVPSNRETTRLWCIQIPPPPPDAGMGADAGEGADGGGVSDGGGDFDAGAGQAPGSRCDRDDQCRHQRCVRGVSGDSFCAAPCTSDDDCAEFRTNSGLDELHSACIEDNGERLCAEVAAVPRPGWTARLEAGLFEVRARISLSDAHSLQVRDFYYDGRRHGQEVYIALSSGPINAQNAILVSPNLRCFAGQCLEGHPCEQTEGTCSDADFDLPLPVGLMYEQFDRASVVGMPQGVAWSEAEFRP